ncbi:MAG: exonuclease SbcCD subunit D [Candidatus Zixiibacteriota bacterium]
MSDSKIRILFFADSHLGFDLPFNPKVKRRRRGKDIFDNYYKILERAKKPDIDILIHGGDIFYRSKFPMKLSQMVFDPLHEMAKYETPVYIVPGNHERSQIPHGILAISENINIFHKPYTFLYEKDGFSLSLSGFPFYRTMINGKFEKLIEDTGYDSYDADIRLLCIHQLVQGATVGPGDYIFKNGEDVIEKDSLPKDFDCILSGHIHRYQVLDSGEYTTPVLYPGSIERISSAEIDEPKGYIILEFTKSQSDVSMKWEFEKLPTRPMIRKSYYPNVNDNYKKELIKIINEVDENSILYIDVFEKLWFKFHDICKPKIEELRKHIPETMNLTIRYRKMPIKK